MGIIWLDGFAGFPIFSGSSTKLVNIPPFTPNDWITERAAQLAGEVLRCPNCNHHERYEPVSVLRDDGVERRYRACKCCGCWQEADGTPAYRCSLVIHSCTRAIGDGAQCANCAAWGPLQAHRCPRVLPPKEIGVTKCRHCGVEQTEVNVVGWPISAD